ncbi:MAG: hypothetical protein NTZ24_07260 [Deltaproteobacteria bacterium]|nr:hypothetical protein [Deltaproteobacteria bacterium]
MEKWHGLVELFDNRDMTNRWLRDDFPELLLILSCLPDHANASLTNPRYLRKPFTAAFNYLQGILAEFGDDALGHDRTDAFDQARTQVLLNAVDGGGGRLGKGDLELTAIFLVVGPFAFHAEDLPGSGADQIADTGDEVFVPGDFDLGIEA